MDIKGLFILQLTQIYDDWTNFRNQEYEEGWRIFYEKAVRDKTSHTDGLLSAILTEAIVNREQGVQLLLALRKVRWIPAENIAVKIKRWFDR